MPAQRLKTRGAGSPVHGVLVSLGLSCLLLLGGCSADPDDEVPLPEFTSTAGTFNDADVRFAQEMAPHHDQAVQMSRIALEKRPRARPEIRSLAADIIAVDEPEIDLINGWLKAWGREHEVGAGSTTGGHHGGGGGVLSETEMRELDEAGGLTGEKLFLTEMIEHHQGAVALSDAEIRDGTNPAAIDFATRTRVVQLEQIALMQRLLEAG